MAIIWDRLAQDGSRTHGNVLTSGRSQCAACVSVVTQAKEKYEKTLDELSKCTPHYMEGMEQQFEQCQNFEERRLLFIREVLLDVKHHLNLTENQRFETSEWADATRRLNVT